MKHKYFYLIIIIFLVTFTSRLYFAFKTDGFSDDNAYYIIKQVEHIKETGVPIYKDDLSYSGRIYLTTPLYLYLLAFFDSFMPYTFKIIPNLFASLIVIIAFFIAKEISKNTTASVFTAFVAGFVPIYFASTVNSISAYSAVIPIALFMMYCFLKINTDKRYIIYFIISSFVLALTHASAFIVILSLLIYLLFMKVENISTSKAEFELIIFSTLLITWIEFLVYKNAFLKNGLSLIWLNIPKELVATYFAEFDLLKAISTIGVIPFIFGIYMLYHSIFEEKRKQVYMIISFILVVLLILWLKLVRVNNGLTFLGVLLALMFAYFLKRFVQYISKTKIHFYKSHIIALLVIIFIVSSVIPSFVLASFEVKKSFSASELSAFEWIRENTKKNSVILASIDEGNLISQISERKNVYDTNFMLINDVDQRIKDVRVIFQTILQTEAISLLNKYDVDYIYFSPRGKQMYGVKELAFIDDNCFDLVYDKAVKIYEVKCRIEEQ